MIGRHQESLCMMRCTGFVILWMRRSIFYEGAADGRTSEVGAPPGDVISSAAFRYCPFYRRFLRVSMCARVCASFLAATVFQFRAVALRRGKKIPGKERRILEIAILIVGIVLWFSGICGFFKIGVWLFLNLGRSIILKKERYRLCRLFSIAIELTFVVWCLVIMTCTLQWC